MAERRMFAMKIIDSDAFLDMPLSTQALYFHLCMRADDDGFVNNPKKIQRMVGASDDDIRVLSAKKFIIPFDTGIVVIKHWKIHNYIQKDRYNPTSYAEEKARLIEKENHAYSVMDTECIQNGYSLDTECIQDVHSLDTQVSIDKLSIDKSNKYIGRFKPPSLEDVRQYCAERKNGIDAQAFIDFYTARGWCLTKGVHMKDWRAAVRTWEQRKKPRNSDKYGGSNFEQKVVHMNELENIVLGD